MFGLSTNSVFAVTPLEGDRSWVAAAGDRLDPGKIVAGQHDYP
jgi:hypothetical protein